jgi:hypothetical protein
MSGQRPTVGRIVHCVAREGLPVCLAAIVTREPEAGLLCLTVFEPGEPPGVVVVAADPREFPRDFEGQGPTWHWPEREP